MSPPDGPPSAGPHVPSTPETIYLWIVAVATASLLIADIVGVNARTVERDWRYARAFLAARLPD